MAIRLLSCPHSIRRRLWLAALALGSALVIAAVLAGLLHARARHSWANAQSLEKLGQGQRAIREYATAIRHHVPLSPVTPGSSRRLLALGEAAEARGDTHTAVAAYQALAASLEAVGRPLAVEPETKATARQQLGLLLGTDIPEPVGAAANTWIPSLLFALWCGTVCRLAWSPPLHKWPILLAIGLAAALLVALRFA